MTTSQMRPITPPTSTLSTPSPTELQDQDPIEAETTKNMLLTSNSSRAIYLIVATTRYTHQGQTRLGIGLNGGLPWPMIKADMTYFRKITTEGNSVPNSPSVSGHSNSVIMGRKTYGSIPEKFRPLPGRTNIVVTRRKIPDLVQEMTDNLNKGGDKNSDLEVSTQPLEGAVRIVTNRKGVELSAVVLTNTAEAAVNVGSREIYCIGGSEIYNLFLKNELLRPRLRILQTVIEKLKDGEEFECDKFWPEPLGEESSDWREVKKEELTSWTGVDVPQKESEWATDGKVGVRIRVVGWESTRVQDRL